MEDQVVLIVKTPAKIAGKRRAEGDTVAVSRALAIELIREGVASPPTEALSQVALNDAAQIRSLKGQVADLTGKLAAANARIAELEAAAADINTEGGEIVPESEDSATATAETVVPDASETDAEGTASAAPVGEAQPPGTNLGADDGAPADTASDGDTADAPTTNTSQGATSGKSKTAKNRKTSASKA